MVDRQDGDAVGIGKVFEGSQRRILVLLVGTLAMLRFRRNPGPGINGHQSDIGMSLEVLLQMLKASLIQAWPVQFERNGVGN